MSYKPFTTKYTWEIIDDIKEYLKETNKDQTTLDTLDLCHLIGEIERLHSIIKEVRELLESKKHCERLFGGVEGKNFTEKALEILEKENKNE